MRFFSIPATQTNEYTQTSVDGIDKIISKVVDENEYIEITEVINKNEDVNENV